MHVNEKSQGGRETMNSYLLKDLSFKNSKMRVYKNISDPELALAVPSNENATDYYPRIYNLVQTLATVNRKTEQEIIASLKSAYTDRLQFRIITEESQAGKIPLDYAARCIEGLKDLILYAACAEENAKPVCARTNSNAKRSLAQFQFGQTQVGSFVFNVEVRVVDENNEQLFLPGVDIIPPESVEHKIIKRIGTAITQIDATTNRQIKINDLVERGYIDGATANMCDALSLLKPEKPGDITVETSIYYAEAITREVTPPKVFLLGNGHFSYIDEISKRYKDCTLIEDVSFEGTIKMLSKSSNSDDGQENTVRLLSKIDGQLRSITMTLAPNYHTLACDAYRDDKEVRVSGTLDKSGKYWVFTEITEFTVL